MAVENPATEETTAEVGTASPEQLDAAIAGARESARAWAATPAVERAEVLHGVANRMRALTDDLARALTPEGGKPLVENPDEVGWTAPLVEAGAWADGRQHGGGEAVRAHAGVDADAGRMLLRPAAGVVNLVAGAGDVGAALVEDERIDGVAFTGSVATGKKVAAACAQRVARMNLEMGGKDPFIVCADVGADVGVAAKGGAWAAYLNAGQVCTSAERFYVQHRDQDRAQGVVVPLRAGRLEQALDDQHVAPLAVQAPVAPGAVRRRSSHSA